jgi:hypothetical protein
MLVIKQMDVQRASDDVRRRTLAGIPQPLSRFIYLASTRDYNTGMYYHDGLASQFSPEVACEALADCHREAFQQLVTSPLEGLVAQLESHIADCQTHATEFLAIWKGIEPYRVAIPVGADPFAAEFLFSNFRVALAILEERLNHSRSAAQAA